MAVPAGQGSGTADLARVFAGAPLLRADCRAKLPKLEHGLCPPCCRLLAAEGNELPDVEVATVGGGAT